MFKIISSVATPQHAPRRTIRGMHRITRIGIRVYGSQADVVRDSTNLISDPESREEERRILFLRGCLQGTGIDAVSSAYSIAERLVDRGAIVSCIESARGFLASGPATHIGPMMWRAKSAGGSPATWQAMSLVAFAEALASRVVEAEAEWRESPMDCKA
jgi:hypothetical protein